MRYHVLEEKDQARQSLEMMQSSDAKNIRILFALAGIYYLEEKYNKSILMYQKILSLAPKNSQEAQKASENLQQVLIQSKTRK